MNRSETAQLLTKIAAFDRRTIGEADVLAWHEILEPFPLADCLDAVRAYFSETREWCMPSDVVQRVQAVRTQRLRDAGTITPNECTYERIDSPTGWSQSWSDGYYVEARALRDAIVAGQLTPERKRAYERSGLPLADFLAGKPAIERRDVPMPPEVRALCERAGVRIPDGTTDEAEAS